MPCHGFFFLLSSATLSARWTELDQNRPHTQKWVQFENAGPKSGVSPLPTTWGPDNHPFQWFRNLTETLTVYIFGTEHDIHKQEWVGKQGVSYVASKLHELWSTNGFKLEASFHPLSVSFTFHFIARLHRQRSANRTQPTFAKWRMVKHTNNLS